MASEYRKQLNQWLGHQSFTADQVLEIGCEKQLVRDLAKVEAKSYTTMDMDPEKKPDYVHDLNEYAHPDEIFQIRQNPRFDLIFCINVFEYVWNPYNAISNLYSWCKPGGTVVVNFPFLYPLHNPVGIDYLRYTHEWVNKMFHERFKFADIETKIIKATTGRDVLRTFYSIEGMHTRRDDDSYLEIGCIVRAKR